MTRPTAWILRSMLVLAMGSIVDGAGAATIVAGGRGGWTLTDLAGGNDGAAKSRQSAVLGGVIGWEPNAWFSLRVEPGWTQKGADVDNFTSGDLPSAIRLDYFEIPVLARFKRCMPADSRGGLFAVVGPSVAINTQARLTVAGGDENIAAHVRDADFGLALGVGWDLAAETGVVSFEARYVHGFSDCFEASAPRQDITSDLSNRALQVTVTWSGHLH